MKNKYKYLKVIQQDSGAGWEDASEYETNSFGTPLEKSVKPIVLKSGRKLHTSLLREDFKAYVESGYPTRIIKRREIR